MLHVCHHPSRPRQIPRRLPGNHSGFARILATNQQRCSGPEHTKVKRMSSTFFCALLAKQPHAEDVEEPSINLLRTLIAEPQQRWLRRTSRTPPQVLAGVFAVLQYAGLQPEYLSKLGYLLGQDLPLAACHLSSTANYSTREPRCQAKGATTGIISQLMASQAPRAGRSHCSPPARRPVADPIA